MKLGSIVSDLLKRLVGPPRFELVELVGDKSQRVGHLLGWNRGHYPAHRAGQDASRDFEFNLKPFELLANPRLRLGEGFALCRLRRGAGRIDWDLNYFHDARRFCLHFNSVLSTTITGRQPCRAAGRQICRPVKVEHRVPEELVRVGFVEAALLGDHELLVDQFRQVPLNLPLRTAQIGRNGREQREALAAGAGVARQPRPEQLGAVRNGAAGEQRVGHEDARVQNLARDEDLADLPSLALGSIGACRQMKLGVHFECVRRAMADAFRNLSETRCYEQRVSLFSGLNHRVWGSA